MIYSDIAGDRDFCANSYSLMVKMAVVHGGQDLALTNECDKHPNFIYDASICIYPVAVVSMQLWGNTWGWLHKYLHRGCAN